ncbi:hypothetical protein MM440_06795 [Arsenicicoccus piscis]|uniref:ParB/Sulfiredoxin domain-containing protein n=1 Tax=Arsenicicoccus piscis TaxID=673954 RepID=A0ABQ6HT43_9MICO|nr:hypothetical protein [Arsenicicoccus piscis]MCH8627498.1 hypothetical protein [Arsenicicoccus piscis]GMA21673.1 hypothetical protein GCM10025862_36940 [Arsenicicoccus piscis]
MSPKKNPDPDKKASSDATPDDADAARVDWQDTPEEHDYPAAASYLSLLADDGVVEATVAAFRVAQSAHFKAKDILRAAGLALLPIDNPHVASGLRKVHRGVALSPVLLVRGDAAAGRPALIADGYHRVCASYHTDENTDVPVRIVALSAGVVPASAVPADRR